MRHAPKVAALRCPGTNAPRSRDVLLSPGQGPTGSPAGYPRPGIRGSLPTRQKGAAALTGASGEARHACVAHWPISAVIGLRGACTGHARSARQHISTSGQGKRGLPVRGDHARRYPGSARTSEGNAAPVPERAGRIPGLVYVGRRGGASHKQPDRRRSQSKTNCRAGVPSLDDAGRGAVSQTLAARDASAPLAYGLARNRGKTRGRRADRLATRQAPHGNRRDGKNRRVCLHPDFRGAGTGTAAVRGRTARYLDLRGQGHGAHERVVRELVPSGLPGSWIAAEEKRPWGSEAGCNTGRGRRLDRRADEGRVRMDFRRHGIALRQDREPSQVGRGSRPRKKNTPHGAGYSIEDGLDFSSFFGSIGAVENRRTMRDFSLFPGANAPHLARKGPLFQLASFGATPHLSAGLPDRRNKEN